MIQPKGQVHLSCLVLLVAFHFSAAAAAQIDAGFSGLWFDPQRNGEGLQLEILDADHALLGWYTYNDEGEQRWFQGVGQIRHATSGGAIEFPQIYVTHGGGFGAASALDNVELQVAGSATLSFSDCNTGSFRYDAFLQSQTLPMQRLTQTMGAGCTPTNGIVGQPVLPHAGQSGSWFDVSHNGEGFDLQWTADDAAIVTWYTYDTAGNQMWLLGVGNERNGAIVVDHLARTRGPHFGPAYDPEKYKAVDWGTLTLQLDCDRGTARYASTQPGFGAGTLTLTRLTRLSRPGCPAGAPKLSDLYAIRWNEIPIDSGTPAQPSYPSVEAIADDGTIAGRRDGHLMLWHADTHAWEDVPRQLAALPVAISPDGATVIANDALDASLPQPDAHTLKWQRATGWQKLPGMNLSMQSAVSHDFSHLAGTGRDGWNDADQAWVQALDGAQTVFSLTSVPLVTALAVSDDGRALVGGTLRFTSDFPSVVAMRRDDGGQPVFLHDPAGDELEMASACDATCSIVYGEGVYDYFHATHEHPGEAWYLKSNGAFGYLGSLADALVDSPSYAVTDTTPDGSLVVGVYRANVSVADVDSGGALHAFVWTQATGMVSVRSLMAELGIGDDEWRDITAVRVSHDGHRLLVGGYLDTERFRAAVIELAPK